MSHMHDTGGNSQLKVEQGANEALDAEFKAAQKRLNHRVDIHAALATEEIDALQQGVRHAINYNGMDKLNERKDEIEQLAENATHNLLDAHDRGKIFSPEVAKEAMFKPDVCGTSVRDVKGHKKVKLQRGVDSAVESIKVQQGVDRQIQNSR